MSANDQVVPELRAWAFDLQSQVKKADIVSDEGTELKIRKSGVKVRLPGRDWEPLTPPEEPS